MGLKTLIVGHAIDDAKSRIEARSELSVTTVEHADDVLAVVDGSEPAIVLLPVKDVDGELATIATLVARGAQVVVLAGREDAGIRVAAFSSGVSDVVFPPFRPWFIEETVLTLAGNPLRKDARVPAQMEALLVPIGGVALAGNLVNLSIGEFRARVSGSLPPGAILRVALKPPRPHRLPVLFARATKAETLPDGRLEIRARFVGTTSEEQALLGAFLEQQPAEVEDVAGVLATIDFLDAAVIREAVGRGSIGGLPMPALTAPELAWLRAAPGTADAALSDVTVARVRAELTVTLLDSVGADLVTLSGLPVERFLDEIDRALRALKAAMELFRRDERLTKDLRALQGRLEDAAAALDRIGNEISADASAAPDLAALIPIDAPARRRTPVGDADDVPAIDVDDQVALEEVSAVSNGGGVIPADFANAPTNPQIPALDAAKTAPRMLNPDTRTPPPVRLPDASKTPPPRQIPPPPALPPPPGVASPRTGRRLRNPFDES